MVLMVVLAFALQTFLAHPDASSIAAGFIPQFKDVNSILLATGILGATVMPHAIYLHSSLTQHRVVGRNEEEKRKIFKFEFIDILIAMVIAGAINMSMLIIAAAVFHTKGMNVEDLDIAFHSLGNMVGPMASISFGFGPFNRRFGKFFCWDFIRGRCDARIYKQTYQYLFCEERLQ